MQQACALISGFVVLSFEIRLKEQVHTTNPSMSRKEKFLWYYCLISSPVSIWGLPISEMVASISYNANDLIFQYSKWTCPCWIWIQHHFGSSGFNRNVHNAKITTSKRGLLFVLIMPVQQVQEQKALILKTRKTWISFPIKKKHSPDIVCVCWHCNIAISHLVLTVDTLNSRMKTQSLHLTNTTENIC